ncbi:MAG: fructosamine kinase family protein [Steroidobacteraceae bacterium]|nr:fructosamine kinase family protein [Steroidobacteraceae bacterium]
MSAAFLEPALRAALGDPRLTCDRVVESGSALHATARVETRAGVFFAKWSARGPADQFLGEAAGLAALRDAAGEELVVPRVIAAAAPHAGVPGFLILEHLEPGASSVAEDERLGRGLARVHRRSATAFGFGVETYCGGTPQDNREATRWPDFYRDRRLLPLLVALERERGLSASDRRLFERLAARLPELVAAEAPPALIHGDLWSGNVLHTTRGPALIDPSCAFADREMEFGITTLFGGLSARAWAAYEEAWPLPAGWRLRNGLYQLYHVLNHALLFGGGYAAQAREVARHYAG